MRLILCLLLALAAALPLGTSWAGAREDGDAAYDRKDYATALGLIRPLAAQGDAWAQYKLALMYVYGKGVVQDYVEAAKWFKLAAAQGHMKAQYSLGVMHDSGHGVVKDHGEAVTWYRLAAAQGYAWAQYNLGFKYDEGLYIVQDYVEAVKWYRLAAEQGDALAQSNLGLMYYKGLGVAQDYVRAYVWFNLAAVYGKSETAAKNRDVVAKRMTPEQVTEAQKLARECQARNFRGCGRDATSPVLSAGPRRRISMG